MIIPIRCFTCGKVLANKWKKYDEEVKKVEASISSKGEGDRPVVSNKQPLHENFENPFRGHIMDKLGLTKICCRRHMLGHVELIDTI